tara:strand:- start:957 stop:1334 length:378 start_codon:yes stop_codon:yes gene_type:complete
MIIIINIVSSHPLDEAYEYLPGYWVSYDKQKCYYFSDETENDFTYMRKMVVKDFGNQSIIETKFRLGVVENVNGIQTSKKYCLYRTDLGPEFIWFEFDDTKTKIITKYLGELYSVNSEDNLCQDP